MAKRLYIIGNGFDLHFNLKTGTDDFKKILNTKKSYDGYSALDTFDYFGVNWSDYEDSLADFDLDNLAYDIVTFPDYLSDHEYVRDGTITSVEYHIEHLKSAVEESLKEMVRQANKDIETVNFTPADADLIDCCSPILNFNYTSTIEKLYHRESYHIHGFGECNEKLVFGYLEGFEARIEQELNSDIEDDHDYYVDTQKQLLVDLYKHWKKSLRVNELKDFLSRIGTINEVVVLGSSMGRVDSVYYELIEKQLNPPKWTVYYHSKQLNCGTYSFTDKVSFKEW